MIAKFSTGYIQFIKIKDTTRIHLHFRNLIPNALYRFYIHGFFMEYELCNLKSNYKKEINYIFYDDRIKMYRCISILGKKINIYENNTLIDHSIII